MARKTYPFEAGYTPAEKRAETLRLKRHSALVDKKYIEGLTPEETAELEQIGKAGTLAEADALLRRMERLLGREREGD